MKAVVAIFEQLVPISGGGTPRTSHIIRALVRRGHQVHVAAAFGVPSDEACRELSCRSVTRLRHVSRLDRRKMAKYLVAYPWNILSLAFTIIRQQPDLVLTHNSIAAFGALLGSVLSKRTVVVMDLTDLLFEYLVSYPSAWMAAVLRIGRALEQFSIRHSDRVITISEAMRQILIQDYGLDPQKAAIVHDGVDCQLFRPRDSSSLRAQISPWARHVCVLHGVIDPQDGPELLVEAAPEVLSRLPDTAFWWVGDGAAVPGLRAAAQRAGLEDKFLFSGWLRQPQVVDYVNACDLGLVILPDVLSARGRVTLKEFEYWACGKAAILPRLPALQEIVTDGEGSLFYAPGDRADLADKICVLLSDDDRRRAMGARGQQIVNERFEWRGLTDEIARLCEEYVAAR
jgi:glycosyltransferase involved in cell wall biosynthesis